MSESRTRTGGGKLGKEAWTLLNAVLPFPQLNVGKLV